MTSHYVGLSVTWAGRQTSSEHPRFATVADGFNQSEVPPERLQWWIGDIDTPVN
jgi:hypothetical protein